MKLMFFILVLATIFHLIDTINLSEEWERFQVSLKRFFDIYNHQFVFSQSKYEKNYPTEEEKQARFLIFKNNFEEIEKHNELYYRGEKTFKKDVNKFADWTEDEFSEFIKRGSVGLPRKFKMRRLHIKEDNYTLPISVDWRKKGAVTRVKDQGLCGACYAFSSVGAIEGQLKIKSGKLVTLSEQHIIDCSWPQGNQGCIGGLAATVMSYVKNFGIESEFSYPYIEKDGKCKYDPGKIATKVKSFVSIPEGSEEDLQYVLANVGPVAVAIDSTFELQGYDEGILDDNFCTTYELTHGVLVVGYGVDKGVEYYIIKNSWGADWGENGYFRLVRNRKNRCGIASLAIYPII